MQKLLEMLNEYRRLDEKRRRGEFLNKQEDFRYKDLRDMLDRHFQQRKQTHTLNSPTYTQSPQKHRAVSSSSLPQLSPRWQEVQADLLGEYNPMLQELFSLEQKRRHNGLSPTESDHFAELMDDLFQWLPSMMNPPVQEETSSPQWQAIQRRRGRQSKTAGYGRYGDQTPSKPVHTPQTRLEAFRTPAPLSRARTGSFSTLPHENQLDPQRPGIESWDNLDAAGMSSDPHPSGSWMAQDPDYDVSGLSDPLLHPPEALESPSSTYNTTDSKAESTDDRLLSEKPMARLLAKYKKEPPSKG